MSVRLIEGDFALGEAEALKSSARIMRSVIADYAPDYIVSMVSGGRDSAASHQVAEELGVKIDLIVHGWTRTGIPQTTEFVTEHYGSRGPDFAIADAGTAYEDYVQRKGFFGLGPGAHAFSYRVLKATPFRRVLSAKLRQRKRGVKILLLNGARRSESANRASNLPIVRADPAAPGNLWVNLIHDWSADERDDYLTDRAVCINPVAKALCRSGECMCGTMQTRAERLEAAAVYPEWGAWLAGLEAEVIAKHGFGWGVPYFHQPDPNQGDLFQPMCADCETEVA